MTGGIEPLEDLVQPIYTDGPRRRIYAYRRADGSVPVLEGLDSLDPKAQARYGTRFKEMGLNGQLRGKYYHPWKGSGAGMGAFKDNQSQTRIPAFPDGDGILIVTHVITGKKEDKLNERDVRKARGYRDEYFKRKMQLAGKSAAATRPRRRRR